MRIPPVINLAAVDYSYVLDPFHVRLQRLHVSRSRARDELFLLLHYAGPCTRQQILQRLSTSKVPFYLNLNLFLKNDIAKEIKPGLFELTDRFKQHHHFMRCRVCKKSTGFYDEGLEMALIKKFARSGFALEDHEISITGICQRCLLNPKNQPRHSIGTRLRRYILNP